MSTRYGGEFDSLAERWAALEREHDKMHPDRNECGGVGGCSLMMASVKLEQAMVEALEEWRRATR